MRIRFGTCLLLLALTVSSEGALALVVGDVHVESAPHRPLSAVVDLGDLAPEDFATLTASHAGPAAYAAAGLTRPAITDQIRLTTDNGEAGNPVLVLSSRVPVDDDALTLVIEFRWARGVLTRQIRLVIRPWADDTAANAVPVAMPMTEAAPAAAEAAPAAAPDAAPPVAPMPSAAPVMREETVSESPAGGERRTASRYAVVPHDTLYGISRRFSGAGEASLEQTMVGIYHANPSAFFGSLAQLRSGVVLSVPASAELRSIPAAAARAEVRAGAAATPAAADAPLSGTSSRGRLKLRLAAPVPDAAEHAALAQRAEALEGELKEARQRLSITNEALARLKSAAPGAPVAPAPTGSDDRQDAAAGAAAASGGGTALPAAVDLAESGSAAPKPVRPRPATVPVPVDSGPSLADLWPQLLGALVVVAGGIAFYVLRGRRRLSAKRDEDARDGPADAIRRSGRRR